MQQTTSASRGVAITPSDTVSFQKCECIWVGGAGVVVVVFSDSSTAAYTCVAGTRLMVKAIRVNATNTTATLMVAEY